MARARSLLLAVLVLLVAAPALAASAATPRADQWGLEKINAPEAWKTSRGAGVVVAVLDTGIHLSHPDLASRLLRDRDGQVVGRDFIDGGAPQDENGHGTLVAGIVAAATDSGVGGPGIAGVAPDARLMPIRVLDAQGRGRVSDIDAGIRWAVDNGADVVNLSLESAAPLPGGLLGGSGLDAAVNYAWERGAVVVAAAGNSGTPFTDFRSSTPVLLVGATDRNDRRAAFSDGGRRDMVMAPGVDIVTSACANPCGTGAGSGYATASGTSFAAPHVAGAIAVLRSAGRTKAEAVDRLRSTAVSVSGGALVSTGHGRIDLAAAVGAPAKPPAPSPSPTRTTSPTPSPEPSTPAPSADRPPPAEAEPFSAESDGAPATAAPDDQTRDAPADPSPDEAPDLDGDEGNDEAAEADGDGSETDVPLDDGDDSDTPAATPTEASADASDLGAVDIGASNTSSRVGLLEGVAAALVAVSGALAVGAHRRETRY